MENGNSLNDSPDNASEEQKSSDSILSAISGFKELESLLHGDDDSFDLPLREVIKLFPEDYVTVEDLDELPDESVTLRVDDLFYQLSKGKVELSCSDLAAAVPAELIRPQALEDEHTVVRLPLQIVVKALDPNLLRDRTAAKASRHKAIDMPDPFARKPGLEEKTIESTRQEAPAEPEETPTQETPEEIPVEEPPAPTPPPVEEVVPQEQPTEPAVEVPLVKEEAVLHEQPSEPVPEPPVAAEKVAAEEPSPESMPEPPTEETEEVVTQDKRPMFAPKVTVSAPPPVEQPVVEEAAPPTAPVVEEVPVPQPPPPVPADTSPAVAAKAPEPVYEELDSPAGVNLNSATKEQLLTLDGVTLTVAEAILSHRDQHGAFNSIFDVQEIPRVGRKTFRKITGMPYSKTRRHRRWKLAKLLRLDPAEAGRLPSVTEALVSRPGFSGCIISDKDGLLLAQYGADECAESLSAVAPRLLQQLEENVAMLNIGGLDCVSLSIGAHMLTVVACEKICLTAIHARNKLTKGQITLVTKTATELAWLLSHRGYIGR